ncbi:hypothetical protein HDU67_003636 [Dinochytrium kinnereticum]|nr:hypothetical protein HDU67_003636 [Dinochytrium kinnereticum]
MATKPSLFHSQRVSSPCNHGEVPIQMEMTSITKVLRRKASRVTSPGEEAKNYIEKALDEELYLQRRVITKLRQVIEVYSAREETSFPKVFAKIKVLGMDITNLMPILATHHTEEELKEIFSKCPTIDTEDLRPPHLIPPGHVRRRRIVNHDTCPICFDLLSGQEASLKYCDTGCGKALHSQCYHEWIRRCLDDGKDGTCVYCRAVTERNFDERVEGRHELNNYEGMYHAEFGMSDSLDEILYGDEERSELWEVNYAYNEWWEANYIYNEGQDYDSDGEVAVDYPRDWRLGAAGWHVDADDGEYLDELFS